MGHSPLLHTSDNVVAALEKLFFEFSSLNWNQLHEECHVAWLSDRTFFYLRKKWRFGMGHFHWTSQCPTQRQLLLPLRYPKAKCLLAALTILGLLHAQSSLQRRTPGARFFFCIASLRHSTTCHAKDPVFLSFPWWGKASNLSSCLVILCVPSRYPTVQDCILFSNRSTTVTVVTLKLIS